MVDVLVIPYSNYIEKREILNTYKDIKFSDLANCLMNIQYKEEEKSAYILCRELKYK